MNGRRVVLANGRRRAPSDRGAATVLALSVVAVVLSLTVAGLVLVSVVVASHRARLAADLGSLAGAAAIQDGLAPVPACAEAERVARTNGATPRGCSVVGEDLDLRVVVPATLWPQPASARARAGPQD